MKEKLIIKNFGPIKSVELELGNFTIIIGEQATGKSTVARVLAVCRYFSYIALDNVFSAGQSKFSGGLAAWGLEEAVKKDSYIFYQCDHYALTVKQVSLNTRESNPDAKRKYQMNDIATFVPELRPLSNEFSNLLNELNKIYRAPTDIEVHYGLINRTIPTSFYQNDVAKVMANPFYLPAERGLQSIFSLGKNSIQNISDALFNQLAQLDQIARLFKKDTQIDPLDITYKNVDGRGYIRKNNEKEYYSLYNAASGYQSTIPVVLMAKYYAEIRKKRKTFIIEEPELNLYPTAQQKLIQYLAATTVDSKNVILATTHSPYVLAALNNLLYAGKLSKLGDAVSKKVKKIIPLAYWLDVNNFSAYKLTKDGLAENIMDKKYGLIRHEKLDEVSKSINSDFDKLLRIELKSEELNIA
jgi:predicted ATPase